MRWGRRQRRYRKVGKGAVPTIIPASEEVGTQALCPPCANCSNAFSKQQEATMEDMNVTAGGYDFAAAHAAMRRYVDGNILSGVSSAVLVGRELVDVNCVGWADREAQTPLRVDHIFRVFSNTKLITSCAALLLFEEGRFQLDDPIEKFIAQLGNRRVLRPGATSLDDA